MNKKVVSTLLTGALTLTLALPSFAADTGLNNSTQVFQGRQRGNVMFVRPEGVNIMELVEKYTPELADRFAAVLAKDKGNSPQERPQEKLDEETREKIAEIRQQLEDGEITKEEAQEQIKSLGIEMPVRPKVQLDEETKEKLAEIRQQLEDGEITKEEAQEQIESLGIEMPVRPKVQLDEETKEKLAEIRQQLEDGEITKEEAQEQIESLGIEMPVRPEVHFEKNREGRLDNDLREQLKEAVESNNIDEIKALLVEMLENMENNQE